MEREFIDVDNDLDNDFVRIPDQSVTERLVEDNRSDFDKEIDEAIYLSMVEENEKRALNIQHEKEIMNEYHLETTRRTEIFKELLINLNRLSLFDDKLKNLKNIVEPIIENYCCQYFEVCELDYDTCENIFEMLKKIRISKIALETLHTIITYYGL